MKDHLLNKLSVYSHLVSKPHTDRQRLTDDLYLYSQFSKLTLKNSLNSRDIDDLYIITKALKDGTTATKNGNIKAVLKSIFKTHADIYTTATTFKLLDIKPTDEQIKRQMFLKEDLGKAQATIKAHTERHKTHINAHLNIYSRIAHIKHDIKNLSNMPIYSRVRTLIYYDKDTAEYKHNTKQERIKDISILQILKVLTEKHRNGNKHGISTAEYKETIKRIKDGKPPRHAVMMKIQLYNESQTKTGTAKHTLKKLRLKEHNTAFYQIHINGQAYKIKLKKHAHFIDIDRFKTAIETDIKTRFKNSNRLIFHKSHADGNTDGNATNTDTL